MFNYLFVKEHKNAGFTYLNQRKNIRHTNLNILVVNTHISGSSSERKTVYLVHTYEPKTKSANFVKIIQMHFEYHSMAWIFRLSIWLYWLVDMQHMPEETFLSARLSTWHMNKLKDRSANFENRIQLWVQFTLDKYWTYQYQSIDC